jgi:hypothetical protein
MMGQGAEQEAPTFRDEVLLAREVDPTLIKLVLLLGDAAIQDRLAVDLFAHEGVV